MSAQIIQFPRARIARIVPSTGMAPRQQRKSGGDQVAMQARTEALFERLLAAIERAPERTS